MLALVLHVAGWVFYPTIPSEPTVRFAWSLPPDARSSSGLGGGIAYALDPSLCEQLLPQFREESASMRWAYFGMVFVSCDAIFDTVHRAFGTWASNHAQIRFFDVTEE